MIRPVRQRSDAFRARFGLHMPLLLSPMAGACPIGLSRAVIAGSGMGAMGAVLSQPADIGAWMASLRTVGCGPARINRIPGPAPVHDAEAGPRAFHAQWGASVPADATPPDFDAQCAALLAARPAVVLSIMGVFRAAFAHRGAFEASRAVRQSSGLFALLPHLADALQLPMIAAGGMVDGRGIAAVLTPGASAAQIGTALLRTPEAGIAPFWADARPERTWLTRAFNGRLGRALATGYVRAHAVVSPVAPPPRSYPVQRGLMVAMRAAAVRAGRIDAIRARVAQSAGAVLQARPSAKPVNNGWWCAAEALL